MSGLEQDLACGEDAQQKPFKTALADLRTLLGRNDLALSPEDRVRLLMMFIISQARDDSAHPNPYPSPNPNPNNNPGRGPIVRS